MEAEEDTLGSGRGGVTHLSFALPAESTLFWQKGDLANLNLMWREFEWESPLIFKMSRCTCIRILIFKMDVSSLFHSDSHAKSRFRLYWSSHPDCRGAVARHGIAGSVHVPSFWDAQAFFGELEALGIGVGGRQRVMVGFQAATFMGAQPGSPC